MDYRRRCPAVLESRNLRCELHEQHDEIAHEAHFKESVVTWWGDS